MPRLSIGFPTFDDPAGLEMSLQSLALYHDLSDVELLVVDNNPSHPAASKLQHYVEGLQARYLPLPAPFGTAPPRNHIFSAATGDVVLVADSHVMLSPTTLPAVLKYFDRPNHAGDILTGPILLRQRAAEAGGLKILATHYADVWRNEMWGIWAQAWACPCGSDWLFDVAKEDIARAIGYHAVAMGRPPVAGCPDCGRQLPRIAHRGHEAALREHGYRPRCWDPDDTEPFAITGLGLGMFACRREAWPGFPPEMIGFGGGELHMHELFRRNGGRAVCHPLCGWWHRFARDRVPYPLELWHKVRNYVLWRNRLEMPLDPVHEHFVAGDQPKMNEAQWQYLLEDPVAHWQWPEHLTTVRAPRPTAVRPQPPDHAATIDDVYDWILTERRDCTAHLPKIRDLAAQSDVVVSLVKRREWDVAVLAGGPDRYVAHNAEVDPLQDRLQELGAYELDQADSLQAEPIDCDLLIIDTIHQADRLTAELARWAPHCQRWIALRGTGAFGERAEGGKGAGLLVAARQFMESNPEWHRVLQEDKQYGLTILSCDPDERSIDQGPGTELHKIFGQIGINPSASCSCRAWTRRMDQWGPGGCREHRDEILDHLKKNQDSYGWRDKLTAARGVLTSGLFLRVNWLDPLPGLVDIAITRAEEAELQTAS